MPAPSSIFLCLFMCFLLSFKSSYFSTLDFLFLSFLFIFNFFFSILDIPNINIHFRVIIHQSRDRNYLTVQYVPSGNRPFPKPTRTNLMFCSLFSFCRSYLSRLHFPLYLNPPSVWDITHGSYCVSSEPCLWATHVKHKKRFFFSLNYS